MNAKRKTANAKRKNSERQAENRLERWSFNPKATVLAVAPNRRQDRTRLAQRLSPIHNSPQGRKMPFSDLNLVERRKITTFADNIIIQRT